MRFAYPLIMLIFFDASGRIRIRIRSWCLSPIYLLLLLASPREVWALAAFAEVGSARSEIRPVSAVGSERRLDARWRLRRTGLSGPVASILADPLSDRLAIGGRGGLVIGELVDGEIVEKVSRAVPGHIVDMVFMLGGDLWVATTEGLFRFSPQGQRQHWTPTAAAGLGSVRRLARLEGWLLVGTDQGVWVFREGAGWRRLSAELPTAPVVALAPGDPVGRSESGWQAELWIVLVNRLYHVVVTAAQDSMEVHSVRRVAVPDWPVGRPALDGIWDPTGGQGVLVFERSLVLFSMPGRSRAAHRRGIVHPHLPPGFRMRRLFNVDERMWLSSEDGLLRAEKWPSHWRRAGAPVGAAPTHAVAKQGRAIFAAGRDGLWSRPELLRHRPV